MKLMENFKVAYDSTVRDADGSIVQFDYGDDGFDAVRIVRLEVPAVLESYNRFEHTHDDELAIVSELVGVRRSSVFFDQWKTEHQESLISCPVDVELLFERAKILSESSTLSFSFNCIYKKCLNLIKKITNELFKNYLILFLQVRRMVELSDVFFEWFLKTLEESHSRAKINPGEMVGVLAGQSVAESVFLVYLFLLVIL